MHVLQVLWQALQPAAFPGRLLPQHSCAGSEPQAPRLSSAGPTTVVVPAGAAALTGCEPHAPAPHGHQQCSGSIAGPHGAAAEQQMGQPHQRRALQAQLE
jgi:hypothetical protein